MPHGRCLPYPMRFRKTGAPYKQMPLRRRNAPGTSVWPLKLFSNGEVKHLLRIRIPASNEGILCVCVVKHFRNVLLAQLARMLSPVSTKSLAVTSCDVEIVKIKYSQLAVGALVIVMASRCPTVWSIQWICMELYTWHPLRTHRRRRDDMHSPYKCKDD